MKKIDFRFDETTIQKLKGLIGRELLSYKASRLSFSNAVYGSVAMDFGDKAYEFSNFLEPMDYFGQLEDVAIFKLKDCDYEGVGSFFVNEDEDVEAFPMNDTVREIYIINENQRLYDNEIQTYDVWFVRGIVFSFENGLEFSLKKDIWFSENIFLNVGDNLHEYYVKPNDEFLKEWDGKKLRGECSREIRTIASDSEKEE